LRVRRLEETGLGRYVERVELGLDFVVAVTSGRIDYLELVTAGDSWDGEEREWRVT
jgi:hypothetical protein